MFDNLESIDDNHIKWVKHLSEKLHTTFPDSSIGISGSVALNKHTKKSDVDFLILDINFKKNKQCVFFKENNIETNLLFLNPSLLFPQYQHWEVTFDGQHLNYILKTLPIFDKNEYIKNLKEKILGSITNIKNKDIDITNRLLELLNSIKLNKKLTNKIDILCPYLNYWFISNGLKLSNKKEHRKAFRYIQEKDPNFHKLIVRIIQNGFDKKILSEIQHKLNLIKHINN